MTGPDQPFRLGYVPGATPAKWARIWAERSTKPLDLVAVAAAGAERAVRDGAVDAALVRLPVDREGLHAIPLYTETSVVVVPKDHVIAAADEVTADDIADDVVFHPLDDALDWAAPPGKPAIERPATTPDALELVAAGVGVVVVPQSLARLYHRRDLTYRPITGVPESPVALCWLEDRADDDIELFIGIVRGRTVNSSRGSQESQQQPQRESRQQPPKRSEPGGRRAANRARTAQRGGSKRRRP
ncbi:LysR family transcriptional regulator substrate-binding protein [Actinokineospora inagensis]|uniref:LysR family transcriptional regulator substrate-binding protein n=1 Tax=Actinokineospora inagensis TaxID=103730 RepID=UPI0003FB3D93|nr:LysR family transcriptional regulator substrate-binding protein [Actinokineospora inagensis]